ncbi:MAG: type I-U CRISPR-associated protein Cas7 [Zoogloeaceae bacterium]|nr:type I-U CRISPR-associated protein Cas7 [Zoogloeaceae bacterium]
MKLDLDTLKKAVAGNAAAFRCVTEYQPMGGPGDKIFPPTYQNGPYAEEERHVPGYTDEHGRSIPVPCVLVNSVQSEANHMELALLDAWEEARIELPVITVDFAGNGLHKDLRISSLEAPHRIADALLRDSELDGVAFRHTDAGKRLDSVNNRNATALLELCPTALIFGMWDSTGPRGGLGAKFARAMVSEVVGINARLGKKTSSRIDPAEIQKNAGILYATEDGGWTLDAANASGGPNKPVKLGKDGRPSEANHGNVVPSIADGGFTVDKLMQTTVLSLPALRRLKFPSGEDKATPAANDAARTVLAALALAAAALTRAKGMDLRSRCQLFPSTEPVWELLAEPGKEPARFELNADDALALFAAALTEAKGTGLPWMSEEMVLKPSPQLATLVQESQRLAAATAGDAESA